MSISQILSEYSDSVNTIKHYFSQNGDSLFKGETTDQYEYSVGIENVVWLEQNLEAIASTLLKSRFQIHLLVEIYDIRIKMQLDRDQEILSGTVAAREEIQILELNVPESAVEVFERYRSSFTEGKAGIRIADFIHSLNALNVAGASFALTLQVFFDKGQIGRSLLRDPNEGFRIVPFLFAEAFLTNLEMSSIESYERDFSRAGRKTVFIIFGYSGIHIGDTLAVCGSDQSEKIAEVLSEPVSEKMIQYQKKVSSFRKSQGTGINPSAWLIPESFHFTWEIVGQKEISSEIQRQFNLYIGLLSALFLADAIEKENDQYWVEYKGYGRVRIALNRILLAGIKSDLGDLYLLYHYAYEGLSLDKLEIAQQFLSLVASNLDALCKKASDINDATKKTYDRSLSAKVEDYFQARHLIQERLKDAVEETTASVIDLSRAVSDDLYKIAGIIAAAVVGSFLEPKLTYWAALGAGIVIAFYVGLVIFYHLRTVNDSYVLKLAQHKSYIESYGDILRDDETTEFLDADHLGKAESMFNQKSKWARNIYIVFMVIAILITVIAGIGLIQGGGTSTISPTPTP
jgi:hypothetical protein